MSFMFLEINFPIMLSYPSLHFIMIMKFYELRKGENVECLLLFYFTVRHSCCSDSSQFIFIHANWISLNMYVRSEYAFIQTKSVGMYMISSRSSAVPRSTILIEYVEKACKFSWIFFKTSEFGRNFKDCWRNQVSL